MPMRSHRRALGRRPYMPTAPQSQPPPRARGRCSPRLPDTLAPVPHRCAVAPVGLRPCLACGAW